MLRHCAYNVIYLSHTQNVNLCNFNFVYSFRVVREQWIRAKYERKEFLVEHDESHRPYQTGTCVCVCVCDGLNIKIHVYIRESVDSLCRDGVNADIT